jgi:hypothetical protein
MNVCGAARVARRSLVIALPILPDWDDFLERIPSPEPFYRSLSSR